MFCKVENFALNINVKLIERSITSKSLNLRKKVGVKFNDLLLKGQVLNMYYMGVNDFPKM